MGKLNLKVKIKSLWAKVKASRDCDPTKTTASPFRDWRRLLSVWFIFLLLILGVSAYLSWRISNLKVSLSPEEEAATIQINSKLVARAKKLIEDRALRFKQNQQVLPVSIDPGL